MGAIYEKHLGSVPSESLENLDAWIVSAGYYNKPFDDRPSRIMDPAELMVCLGGGGIYTLEGAEYRIVPGDLMYIMPEREHSFRNDPFDEPWEVMYIYFKGTYALKLASVSGLNASEPVHHIGRAESILEKFRAIYRILEEKRFNYSFEASLGLISLLFEIRKHQLTTRFRRPAFLNAITYKTESLDKIAERAGYSRYHFIRLFKQATGTTPWDYVLNLKVTRSIELLNNRSLTIKEIAAQVGIENPKYFTRLFRKRMGVSPREYRAKYLVASGD